MPDAESTCGHPTGNGEPCQLSGSRDDGKCHHHTKYTSQQNSGGRPPILEDEDKQATLFKAASSGLTIADQAALTGISTTALRRSLCCVETPSSPTITAENPCDFCRGYTRAHAQGAMQVLQECKPEYRASATFGYVKREKQELMGEDGDSIEVTSEFISVETTDTDTNTE